MSKLAQAGESNTASPERADCAAQFTASSMLAARRTGTPAPATAASMRGASRFADREERVRTLREPRLAAALDETPVLRAPRCVEPESDRLSSGQRHRQAARVVPVEDLDAVAEKHTRLGASVVVDAAVTVQMVFGDVEDRGGIGAN